jgi:hypothetical protein
MLHVDHLRVSGVAPVDMFFCLLTHEWRLRCAMQQSADQRRPHCSCGGHVEYIISTRGFPVLHCILDEHVYSSFINNALEFKSSPQVKSRHITCLFLSFHPTSPHAARLRHHHGLVLDASTAPPNFGANSGGRPRCAEECQSRPG